MARIRWTGGALCQRLRTKIVDEWFMLKLTYWSLFYNTLTSWSSIMDAAMEPVFWIVDHFVRYLGPVRMDRVDHFGIPIPFYAQVQSYNPHHIYLYNYYFAGICCDSCLPNYNRGCDLLYMPSSYQD